MKIQVGDTVVWESQAMGCWKVKRGTVIALIPAGVHISEIWPEALRFTEVEEEVVG